MTKKPFVTKEKLEEIAAAVPTPFHIYDEKGIRENAKAVKEAFSWNPGFREYFAVKANPNPTLIKMLGEYDCGCDCSSYTELMLSDAMGFEKDKIMFSSNVTPAAEYQLAAELGAIINLDDITHIDFLEKTLGYIPKKICCRYNPGGLFKISTDIMDNPGDAKYGMTTEQIFEAFRILKAKGAEEFGIHSFLASNTVTNDYYPVLAKTLFELAVKLQKETGVKIKFINLSGGVGIPYVEGVFGTAASSYLISMSYSLVGIIVALLLYDISKRLGVTVVIFAAIKGAEQVFVIWGKGVAEAMAAAGMNAGAQDAVIAVAVVAMMLAATLILLSEKELASRWGVRILDAGGLVEKTPEELRRDERAAELAEHARLTPRETEILALVAQGKNGPAIMQELFIAEGTFKAHMSHIYEKCGVANRRELVALLGA